MDCRLRSRVAFMVAISAPITFPGDGLTASGASAGPGGSGGSGANTVGSAGHGARVPAAPASLVSLVVSLPVAISATVRWSTISPTDQSFALGFQSAWRCPSPSTSLRTSARTASSSFHSVSTGFGRLIGGLLRRSEEHTSELQSLAYLVCRLLLEKKKNNMT